MPARIQFVFAIVIALSLAPPAGCSAAAQTVVLETPRDAPRSLFELNESEIKFSVESLMSVLRDHRHEGWVLAVYPDPKTGRPLIGAGFSLDVAATEHLQLDSLNPRPFLEPSSAELWQGAGLEPARLRSILDQFQINLQHWGMKGYRRRIRAHTLTPVLTEQDATRLLRISSVQAIANARAYCRGFDQLTASQQMAFSQLVFQMGVNLEEFVDFLASVNGDVGSDRAPAPEEAGSRSGIVQLVTTSEAQTGAPSVLPRDHWDEVQRKLIESQWARRYASRATTVIAMFDPDYAKDPVAAERRTSAILRPPRKRRTNHHRSHTANVAGRRHADSPSKRKLT